MENRPRRPRRKKQSNSVQGILNKLKQSPVAYNAVLIVAVIAVILIVSSIAMNVITRHGTHRAVPDFTGLKLADVEYQAKKGGFKIIINDSLFVPAYEGGIVLDQLPKSGAEVKAGRKVYVTINSFRQKMVKVPYVAGRSLRQAKNMLEVAGLGITELVYVFIVFTEMLALCCNHAVIPPFLKYCSKKPSGLEWGKAGLSLGPGQPLLLPREYLIGHSDPSPVALHCVVCVDSINRFENPYEPPATLHPGPILIRI